ncbi:MAG: PhzF family phenazine biosynthesis protein [Salinirussus sp.]
MHSRDVSVIDAFAPAPFSGSPVGIIIDESDLAPTQMAQMAEEMGHHSTVILDTSADPPTVRSPDPGSSSPGPHAAVAAAHAMTEREQFEEWTLDWGAADRRVTLDADGTPRAALPRPECRPTDQGEEVFAAALGLDPAALRDVAADLPPTRASLGAGVLVVAVNFLEHLGGIEPNLDSLASLLDAAGAETLYAFTFDTLDVDRDVHGVELERTGDHRRPTGAAEACAAAAITRFGALDADRETIRFEAGDRFDRPARLSVCLGDPTTICGPCSTAIEGTIAVPPTGSDDDIVEA